MNPIQNRWVWRLEKHAPLFRPFLSRNAPAFIRVANPGPLEGEVPVFTFHAVLPQWFESQCIHLAENGYETLCADELLSILRSKDRRVRNQVVLTFDDGLKHVWTVAFPLLKKYSLRAVCFLLPGCIPEEDGCVRPNLEDYWAGRVELEEIVSLERGDSALATWAEIRVMHESGVIDFQSHTMYHGLVFASSRIFDFVHPGYDVRLFGNIHIPIYSREGMDVTSRDVLMGMPIYYARPRMAAESRFFDDEGIRNRCIEIVREAGEQAFFEQKRWRRILRRAVADYRNTRTVRERYETPEERDGAVFQELAASRRAIEERLPGKQVRHLCYPWYEAGAFAVEASRRAGFLANYFGLEKGRQTNRPGDDPFRVVRVEDVFVHRLPGVGRMGIPALFKRFLGTFSLPALVRPKREGHA